MAEITVRDNAPESRWEAVADGEVVGFAEYRVDGDVVTFPHTEVHREGLGIGSQLVRAALDKAREVGAQVVPECSFVAGYIEKHPEHADLLAS